VRSRSDARLPRGATLVAMPSKEEEDMVEVRCPECGATVRVTVAEAERTNKAKCPKGHEVPLAKALG
jgi:predicted RNA-binding Zn-ribbon protein involved in translation (DUF1610 family)